MKSNYITAVLEELNAGKDAEQVLSGLKKTLTHKGHDRLYVSILRGVVRMLEAGRADGTLVIVSDEAAFEKQKSAITSALTKLGASDDPKVVVDTTIIGGFIAEANNQQLDKSYKTTLVNLYRSLTR